MPSSRPAVSAVTTVESAGLLQQMLVLGLTDRGDDLRVRREFARGEGDKDGGVVAVGGDDDRLGVLGAGQPQHLRVVALPRTVTRPALLARSRAPGSSSTTTMSAARRRRRPSRTRRPALGAVPDDDGVVAHSGPPSLDLQCLARLCGQGLDGGADQDDQERHPQRRDHQNVDQSRRRGDRGDVAVARCRQRHRGVVDAVQQRQRVVGVRRFRRRGRACPDRRSAPPRTAPTPHR